MMQRTISWTIVVGIVAAISAGCSVRARTAPPSGIQPHHEEENVAVSSSPIVAERDTLFMLAAMSYTYAGLGSTAGYDISAVIAWNVDDPGVTPDFVVDRNRNNELQGDIHHAEINTLRDAYRRHWDYHVAPQESANGRRATYSGALARTTIYTTLEPCPMCQTTITMAKVPRAVFCMEDPGLRSSTTHASTVVIPTQFYGRTLSIQRSNLPACERANGAMWDAVRTAPDPLRFSVTSYVTRNGRTIFGPAWEALSCWSAQPANVALLEELQKATGVPKCPGR